MTQSLDYRGYFTEFLPSILGQLMIDDLEHLTACFEIAVTDDPEQPWRVGVTNGRLSYVGHEGPEPVCRFEVDRATLCNLVAAKETPQDAFFDMRIEVTGDVEMGLMLSTVLEPFFQRYPYGA